MFIINCIIYTLYINELRNVIIFNGYHTSGIEMDAIMYGYMRFQGGDNYSTGHHTITSWRGSQAIL